MKINFKQKWKGLKVSLRLPLPPNQVKFNSLVCNVFIYNQKLTWSTFLGSDSEDELDPEAHKKSLEKLKKIDPDFYTFLEENDENLLNFEADTDAEESDVDRDDDDKIHTPGPLKGDSDESDYEVNNLIQ